MRILLLLSLFFFSCGNNDAEKKELDAEIVKSEKLLTTEQMLLKRMKRWDSTEHASPLVPVWEKRVDSLTYRIEELKTKRKKLD